RPAGGPRRVHVDDPLAARRLSAAILEGLVSRRPAPAAVTVLCIGTDRSTGDALGPLVGTRLLDVGCPRARIMGTLDDPVHAANLHQVLEGLQRRAASRDHVVIAVDACLGRTESVGWIAMKPGPLRPGTGVHKELPAVGDFHIMGIVNVGGFMEYFVLQNTRLSLVMRMANIIAEGLRLGLEQWSAVREAAAARPASPASPVSSPQP
ncbi:MAG: spore protease YyaC, partial [Limnochordales bacterium]